MLTIEELRKRAEDQPGRCPVCQRALAKDRSQARILCPRRACRRVYDRLYGRSIRRPSPLKLITERRDLELEPGRVIEVLACGHEVLEHRSISARRDRRRCPLGCGSGPPATVPPAT